MLKAHLLYATLLWKSIGDKKNFTNLGKIAKVSADTIRRRLEQSDDIIPVLEQIGINVFAQQKVIYESIDTTTIRKMFFQYIEGTTSIYDTKIGRELMGYNLFATCLFDGKTCIPVFREYAEKNDSEHKEKRLSALFKTMIIRIKKLYPDKKIIVVADGFFATVKNLTWCVENNILYEGRMHKNRVVRMERKKNTNLYNS